MLYLGSYNKIFNKCAITHFSYPWNSLGSISCLSTIQEVALPKPRRDAILWMDYSYNIPFIIYPKNTLGSITYPLKLGGVLHNPTKT
jgi:hypothetical protein